MGCKGAGHIEVCTCTLTCLRSSNQVVSVSKTSSPAYSNQTKSLALSVKKLKFNTVDIAACLYHLKSEDCLTFESFPEDGFNSLTQHN